MPTIRNYTVNVSGNYAFLNGLSYPCYYSPETNVTAIEVQAVNKWHARRLVKRLDSTIKILCVFE